MPRGWGRKYDYAARPRKACTAYNFFIQENYRFLRRYLRDRNPHRVLEEAAGRWKGLPRDRKDKYEEMAKQDKIRAENEKREYQRQLADGQVEPPPVRERVDKQPGYPRRTKNAFLYFVDAHRKKVSDENPNYDSREVMQELAKRWNAMSLWKKHDYVRQRDTDRRRYKAQKKQFREKKKDAKRQKRYQEGRERLNRLFHSRIPQPLALQDYQPAIPREVNAEP